MHLTPASEPNQPDVIELTDDDRQALRSQFVAAYEKSQTEYDSSLRTFGAGGVAVTASIGAAIGSFGALGTGAIASFLAALALTMVSHGTAQKDMRLRIEDIEVGNEYRLAANGWTRVTAWMNVVAGLAVLAGCVLLATLVGSNS